MKAANYLPKEWQPVAVILSDSLAGSYDSDNPLKIEQVADHGGQAVHYTFPDRRHKCG